MPVNASTVTVSRPFGFVRRKPSIGIPWETSDRIADHNGADVSSESLPSFGVLSELPIHTPATRPGRLLADGIARKPYAWTSLLSLVVPVLYAAGRTFLPVTPSVIFHLPQNGLTDSIVLPARMSVMMYAAWLETTRSPAWLRLAGGQTWLPSLSSTFRIVWRGIFTPPF